MDRVYIMKIGDKEINMLALIDVNVIVFAKYIYKCVLLVSNNKSVK